MIQRMNQELHFSEAVLNQKIFTPFYKGVKPAVEITGDSEYEAVRVPKKGSSICMK